MASAGILHFLAAVCKVTDSGECTLGPFSHAYLVAFAVETVWKENMFWSQWLEVTKYAIFFNGYRTIIAVVIWRDCEWYKIESLVEKQEITLQ